MCTRKAFAKSLFWIKMGVGGIDNSSIDADFKQPFIKKKKIDIVYDFWCCMI